MLDSGMDWKWVMLKTVRSWDSHWVPSMDWMMGVWAHMMEQRWWD